MSAIYNIGGDVLYETPQNIYPSFSMFKTFGVIGDSFASGEIYQSEGSTGVDYYDVSWPQILARMAGVTATNYSKGGLNTKTWLENADYGLAKLNGDTALGLYIIALGINDGNNSIPIGTISDITSDSTNSFFSYYGRIVRAIKAHAPNAVIMLSTLARWTTRYNPYSDAIKSIGEYYTFPVFDLSESDFFQSTFFAENQISNHPTAVNYSAMASEYKRLVEDELRKHPSAYAGYIG